MTVPKINLNAEALSQEQTATTINQLITHVNEQAAANAAQYAPIVAPNPPVVGAAPPVTAYDAVTGRLQIGGVEMGNTGWRTLVSWNDSGVYTYNALGELSPSFVPQSGVAGFIRVRRQGSTVFYTLSGISTAAALLVNTGYALFPWAQPGFRVDGPTAVHGRLTDIGLTTASTELSVRVIGALASGNILVSSDSATAAASVISGQAAWPTSLPGTQSTAPFTG
jgi:hypothetical protein